MTETTSSRDNRSRTRPRGYANWRPQPKTEQLLEDVATVLERYREHLPLTIRQIYYALVGVNILDKTENAYERLCETMNRARRARLIDFDSIRDDSVTVMEGENYSGVEEFQERMLRKARAYMRDRRDGQPYRVELWCEASGMMPQLARVARPYSIPVYSASGFASLSGVRHIANRAVDDDPRPTLLLHVGDFDPSGAAIFDHIAEDAAAFVTVDRVIATQRIEAVRVALTLAQIAEHNLPTAPAKRSDTRSAKWKGGTCQLEALPPDELAAEVEESIQERLNWTAYEEITVLEEAEQQALLGRLLASGDDEDGPMFTIDDEPA